MQGASCKVIQTFDGVCVCVCVCVGAGAVLGGVSAQPPWYSRVCCYRSATPVSL